MGQTSSTLINAHYVLIAMEVPWMIHPRWHAGGRHMSMGCVRPLRPHRIIESELPFKTARTVSSMYRYTVSSTFFEEIQTSPQSMKCAQACYVRNSTA